MSRVVALALIVAVVAPARVGAQSIATGNWQNDGNQRWWNVLGFAQYRSLVVRDADPGNDASMMYQLTGMASLGDGLTAILGGGVDQTFVAEPQESGFKMRDTQIGALYSHSLEVEGLGRKVAFLHRLRFVLPTSRQNYNQSLVVAPTWNTMAKVDLLPRLSVAVDVTLQYLWYHHQEQRGYAGGMNSVFATVPFAWLTYRVWESPTYGRVMAQVGGWREWRWRYASRETYASPLSDTIYVRHSYGWYTNVGYAPIAPLTFFVGLEHGGPVRDDGVITMYFVRREDTQLVLSMSAMY